MKSLLMLLTALFMISNSALVAQVTMEHRFESVGNDEFKEALASGDFILLDIRTIEEFKEGTIKGAKLIEYNGGDMDAEFEKLSKNHSYLVYCTVGVRSKVGMERMKELGFHYVLELDKGIKEWE